MTLPVSFAGLPPEMNIALLLSGPGSGPTLVSAAAYTALAAQLNAAAAALDGATAGMAESWQGLAAGKANGAFQNYAAWLHEQAAIAAEAGKLIETAAGAYTAAAGEMAGVAAWLTSFRAREAAMLAASAAVPGTAAALVAMEAEYFAIWAAAAGVMGGYAGAVVPALSALPPPAFAPPIVVGGGVEPPPGSSFENPLTKGTPDLPGHPPGPTDTGGPTDTNGPTNTDTGGPQDTNGPTDTTNTDPVQPSDPSTPSDPTSPSDPGQLGDPSGYGADSGYGSNYGSEVGGMDQGGFTGTSPYSTTLAGLNGGMGSVVALGMMRGGIGNMPGASTGFRMPANWAPGSGRAFGAMSNPAATSGAQAAPRRGVTASARQMRRRRDQDKRKSKVFVPGEPQDVPVLEKPPVVGVIEYDDDRRDDREVEHLLPVGIGVLARPEEENENTAEPITERPR
ncbi:PPE domain-containing protein [Nocardia blacklockiae]|uniref:PPE domain-containing protein n=1 Tax=Nocardia blacklockiae TaxID=480036 RepID=UPI0018941F0B|nr:PPE domain-containing protein [Nocardia blacklockiae]MBF6175641.1 PPE domain-containing protein [Nocardia blacklockiae]